MSNPEKQEDIRNPDGTFKSGVSGNPAGRPKGQSMKEFWRQRFQDMSNEEKIQWAKDNHVDPNLIWKMAEGNPKNDIEHSGSLTISSVLDEIEDDGHTTEEQGVADSQSVQDSGQAEESNQVQTEQGAEPFQPKQVVEKYNP